MQSSELWRTTASQGTRRQRHATPSNAQRHARFDALDGSDRSSLKRMNCARVHAFSSCPRGVRTESTICLPVAASAPIGCGPLRRLRRREDPCSFEGDSHSEGIGQLLVCVEQLVENVVGFPDAEFQALGAEFASGLVGKATPRHGKCLIGAVAGHRAQQSARDRRADPSVFRFHLHDESRRIQAERATPGKYVDAFVGSRLGYLTDVPLGPEDRGDQAGQSVPGEVSRRCVVTRSRMA